MSATRSALHQRLVALEARRQTHRQIDLSRLSAATLAEVDALAQPLDVSAISTETLIELVDAFYEANPAG